jgi:hypothetical protein
MISRSISSVIKPPWLARAGDLALGAPLLCGDESLVHPPPQALVLRRPGLSFRGGKVAARIGQRAHDDLRLSDVVMPPLTVPRGSEPGRSCEPAISA